MALKILFVPDKFKGTLTAQDAAEAMARGWRRSRPQDSIELLPMSDGGDGFGELVSGLLGAGVQTIETVDAAHRPCEATWWWHEASQTAVVESARVIGLAQLPAGKFHPFELDTSGLGAVLRAAADHGARRCLVGIGGSATNDGGFGMARSLGWQFFNQHGEPIVRWTELHTVAHLRPPEQANLFEELAVAVDVQNPLLGAQGCTRIYGPQKGLKPDEFAFAERCLEEMAGLIGKELHRNYADEPGAGAAGGLGFGLRCFAGARLEPGFALFARYARLSERLQAAQWVVTGEGAIDASTLMGKGVGELAQVCRQMNLPCLGLAGVVPNPTEADKLFRKTFALAPDFTSPAEALTEPAVWLERLAADVAEKWFPTAI